MRRTTPTRQDAQPRFEVQPCAGGFCAGIDPGKLNQLVDQLEVERYLQVTDKRWPSLPGSGWT
jgi:hypothetical protein